MPLPKRKQELIWRYLSEANIAHDPSHEEVLPPNEVEINEVR